MGFNTDVAGITYNVILSRELNPADAEDQSYITREAPPGSGYFGVFFRACNEDSKPHTTASDFTVRNSLGETFKPVGLSPENNFAYRPRQLNPGQCIPEKGSIASQGPTNGSLIVFQLPFAAIEDTPINLDVVGPAAGVAGSPQSQTFELGIG